MVEVGIPSRISEIASVMGETQDYAQKYRRRLIDAGIIEPTGRGKVSFVVPYLEGYLGNLPSIESLV